MAEMSIIYFYERKLLRIATYVIGICRFGIGGQRLSVKTMLYHCCAGYSLNTDGDGQACESETRKYGHLVCFISTGIESLTQQRQ